MEKQVFLFSVVWDLTSFSLFLVLYDFSKKNEILCASLFNVKLGEVIDRKSYR